MVFESSLKAKFLIVPEGCSTASRRVRMASSRSLRKTKGKDYGLTERKQNTNDLRIGVYITSVPASEGLWSSARNVETTLIEPRPLAIRSGAYRSDAGRRG
jgi:hypothetical protein